MPSTPSASAQPVFINFQLDPAHPSPPAPAPSSGSGSAHTPSASPAPAQQPFRFIQVGPTPPASAQPPVRFIQAGPASAPLTASASAPSASAQPALRFIHTGSATASALSTAAQPTVRSIQAGPATAAPSASASAPPAPAQPSITSFSARPASATSHFTSFFAGPAPAPSAPASTPASAPGEVMILDWLLGPPVSIIHVSCFLCMYSSYNAPLQLHPVLSLARHPFDADLVMVHNLGWLTIQCPDCHALHWLAERLYHSSNSNPNSGMCCTQGKISLPPLHHPSPELAHLLRSPEGSQFCSKICTYNNALAMTLVSRTLNKSLNAAEGGPFSFRLHGEVIHRTGSLLPQEGQQPLYA